MQIYFGGGGGDFFNGLKNYNRGVVFVEGLFSNYVETQKVILLMSEE